MAALKQRGGDKFKKFVRENSEEKKITLQVGFFKGSKYTNGTQVAQVAVWNNFGTRSKKTRKVRIPERPFFSQATEIYKADRKRIIKEVFVPQRTLRKSVALVGKKVVKLIQARITKLKTPEKSEETLRLRPGKTNPLIDTGLMRKSVLFKIDDDE